VPDADDDQVAVVIAAERESLSLECRADVDRFKRLLADGLVMVKYTSSSRWRRANRTSLWRRTEFGHWQIFHHQGTINPVD
jgi:hypothetical protein